MSRRTNISGLLNIQPTTVFFPKKKAKGMKCKEMSRMEKLQEIQAISPDPTSPPGTALTLPGLTAANS